MVVVGAVKWVRRIRCSPEGTTCCSGKQFLMGFHSNDDASVVQLRDDLVVVQSLDFCTCGWPLYIWDDSRSQLNLWYLCDGATPISALSVRDCRLRNPPNMANQIMVVRRSVGKLDQYWEGTVLMTPNPSLVYRWQVWRIRTTCCTTIPLKMVTCWFWLNHWELVALGQE